MKRLHHRALCKIVLLSLVLVPGTSALGGELSKGFTQSLPFSFSNFFSHCPDAPKRNKEEAVEAARSAYRISIILGTRDWRTVADLAATLAAEGDFSAVAHYEQEAVGMVGTDNMVRQQVGGRFIHYYLGFRPASRIPPQPDDPIQTENPAHTNLDKAGLRKSAESGDVNTQARLAEVLAGGANGDPPGRIEAYKWASAAYSKGNKSARFIVQELELFMAPEDLSSARAAAKSLLGIDTKRTSGTPEK